MSKKRPWVEPQVKSLDQLPSVYGECKVGSTPTAGGATQCNAGNGAPTQGACTTGNGASNTCTAGNGQK